MLMKLCNRPRRVVQRDAKMKKGGGRGRRGGPKISDADILVLSLQNIAFIERNAVI